MQGYALKPVYHISPHNSNYADPNAKPETSDDDDSDVVEWDDEEESSGGSDSSSDSPVVHPGEELVTWVVHIGFGNPDLESTARAVLRVPVHLCAMCQEAQSLMSSNPTAIKVSTAFCTHCQDELERRSLVRALIHAGFFRVL